MESHDESHLLLSNKEDLVKYITELRQEGLQDGMKMRRNWNDREKQQKEIKELKKQNEELKQFALDVHNFAFSTKWDDLDIVSAMDLASVVDELKKDECNLYQMIAGLKEQLNGERAIDF